MDEFDMKPIIRYYDGIWAEDGFWEDDEDEIMEQNQDGS